MIVARADGRAADVEDFEPFVGDGLRLVPEPKGVPSSMHWRIDEIRRYAALHAAPEGSGPGPVRLQVGYVVLRMTPSGPVEDGPFEVLGVVTAWPRGRVHRSRWPCWPR